MRKPTVILVHGVWARGVSLWGLSHRLRLAGFAVENFEYASVLHRPEHTLARLRARIGRHSPGEVHVVGHSLGGLVALEAFRAWPSAPPGRLVALGSPFGGSVVARRLLARGFGLPLLGYSAQVLVDGVAPWPATARAVGVVAGSRPYGVGRLIGGLSEPNDGTVAVAETRLSGATAAVVRPVSHTGLAFSRAVACDVADFLKTGCFAP